VDLGSDASEQAHAFAGEGATQPIFEGRRGRVARQGGRDAARGWFSYRLKVNPDAPATLVCTYRGGEGQRRVFDIVVDGERVATETLSYHPTELLDVEYAIPEAITRGKDHVTLRFQPQADASTAEVFEVRVIAGARR